MSELTLLLLRIGFLALMWFFVFAVIYALRTDLFGQRVKRLQSEAAPAAPAAPFIASATAATEAVGTLPKAAPVASTPATRLVITSGAKAGMELSLGVEPLTIGRASESGLVIRDDYTSTYHARLMLWDDAWKIQDLDSTNGTFVDGKRVTNPTTVSVGTPIRIGTTTFELRA
jgi:pSer/pThr/pTyr-binding forkhead associated (FHA) protein